MRRSGRAHGVPEPVGTQGPHMCVYTMGKEPGAGVVPLQHSQHIFPLLRKGRRPTLILRTQLSVRVHAIIGESGPLPPPAWSSSSTALHGGGLASAVSFGQGFCDGEGCFHPITPPRDQGMWSSWGTRWVNPLHPQRSGLLPLGLGAHHPLQLFWVTQASSKYSCEDINKGLLRSRKCCHGSGSLL